MRHVLACAVLSMLLAAVGVLPRHTHDVRARVCAHTRERACTLTDTHTRTHHHSPQTIYGEITKPQLLEPVFKGASAAYFAVPGVPGVYNRTCLIRTRAWCIALVCSRFRCDAVWLCCDLSTGRLYGLLCRICRSLLALSHRPSGADEKVCGCVLQPRRTERSV